MGQQRKEPPFKKRLAEDVAAAQMLFTPSLPMVWHVLALVTKGARGEGGGYPILGHRGGLWHNFCDISGETVEFSGGEGVSLPA